MIQLLVSSTWSSPFKALNRQSRQFWVLRRHCVLSWLGERRGIHSCEFYMIKLIICCTIFKENQLIAWIVLYSFTLLFELPWIWQSLLKYEKNRNMSLPIPTKVNFFLYFVSAPQIYIFTCISGLMSKMVPARLAMYPTLILCLRHQLPRVLRSSCCQREVNLMF